MPFILGEWSAICTKILIFFKEIRGRGGGRIFFSHLFTKILILFLHRLVIGILDPMLCRCSKLCLFRLHYSHFTFIDSSSVSILNYLSRMMTVNF
jgi:hypothetical protein